MESRKIKSKNNIMPQSLLLALDYLEKQFQKSINLEKIAIASSVSLPHLIRLFKKHFKTTPSRYLWKMRTEKGIQLLYNSGLSIDEISNRNGFKNAFHFSRLVKHLTGQSPRELRKNEWGE